jgi:uncharacterized membrane protein
MCEQKGMTEKPTDCNDENPELPGEEKPKTGATIDIKSIIAKEYEERYGWRSAQVSEGTPAFNGRLFIVRPQSGKGDGEICFFRNDRVRIFGSTEDLVEFLESQSNAPLLERLSSRSVVTAIVFLLLVIGIFVAGFFQTQFNKDVLVILGNALGVAAGFFFGQSFARDSQR